MSLLLLGASGQLGRALRQRLERAATLTMWQRSELDLEQVEAIAPALDALGPRIIVNAAAYTAVERAEDEPERAFAVNAAAVAALAQWATTHDALLVHYSTEHVFDGGGTVPWREDDATQPVNLYGESKLAGENAIRAAGCAHWILRTSWLYGPDGHNFLDTILTLAAEHDSLSVVADQIGAPCTVTWLADVTARLLAEPSASPRETLHVTMAGEVSRHGFVVAIIEAARARGLPVKARAVAAIATREWASRAKRPGNSRLALDRLRMRGFSPPAWQEGLKQVMAGKRPPT